MFNIVVQCVTYCTIYTNVYISPCAIPYILGDVVYVDLPDSGIDVSAGDRFASVESTKAASDIYAPIDIHITEINNIITDDSSVVNSSAENDAWFIEADARDIKQMEVLMDEQTYKKHCEDAKH